MSTASSGSILLSGGTIVAFKEETESLDVIRDGALLISDDRIAAIYDTAHPDNLPAGTEVVDCTNKIISPGFIDTHRHGWQTAYKTLASNASMAEYMIGYTITSAESLYTAEDIYIGQLAGLLEALNAGVTTTLDHAHSTWSTDRAKAGYQASVDSSARVFWNYAFMNTEAYPLSDQIADFKGLLKAHPTPSLTTLGVAYDGWMFAPKEETQAVLDLTKELNIPVLTSHYLGGPWVAAANSPENLQSFGILNTDTAVVLSHAMDISPVGAMILRSTNQFISVTPESEMHYGLSHPNSHQIQDQASLGAIRLTQARVWLQRTRSRLYDDVLQRWEIPRNSPMSVNQAFLMATRQGGLALRRPDLGVIRVGAKADLVVFNGRSPGMLGWLDPVAAVILHANVGDIEHVVVDGKFQKRDGKLTFNNYASVVDRFLASAEKIQKASVSRPDPVIEGRFWGGCAYGHAVQVNASRGAGTGYGKEFLHKS
ncbi:Metallo-dependent hydrolase [Hypoxylon sp. NC1633]|nr:Metallo-dependent hydrolase [Hypoxylon sp. NC1633]